MSASLAVGWGVVEIKGCANMSLLRNHNKRVENRSLYFLLITVLPN